MFNNISHFDHKPRIQQHKPVNIVNLLSKGIDNIHASNGAERSQIDQRKQ